MVKVREDKPRYVRDQYLLANSVADNSSGEVIQAALKYCVENELWSAIDFRSAVEYFSRNKVGSDLNTTVGPPVIPETYRIKTTARDIKDYVAVCGGGK